MTPENSKKEKSRKLRESVVFDLNNKEVATIKKQLLKALEAVAGLEDAAFRATGEMCPDVYGGIWAV